MKSKSLLPLVTAVFIITNCGANKAAKDEKQQTNNPSAERKAGPASTPSEPGDAIVGEWEMVGFVVDTNDNLQIDEAERRALKQPTVKDYMKLNRDRSGAFTVAKMPGRYEITDTGSSGKKYLTWYDKANGPHRVGTIIKVTRDELHIKEPGGHGLFLWKRL
jgi:hypothetical protein